MTATTERKSAPTLPATGNPEAQAIAAHMGIHNALSMAVWHCARGNTAAAGRKVRQALAALRQLDRVEG